MKSESQLNMIYKDFIFKTTNILPVNMYLNENFKTKIKEAIQQEDHLYLRNQKCK